jgi:hypothetical protein
MRRRLGILLVAMTLAGCGSVVPQVPSPSTTPGPARPPASADAAAGAPTAVPSGSAPIGGLPGPSAPPIGVVRVPFAGRAMQLTIVGTRGVVVAWRPATDAEVAAVPWAEDDDIALGRIGERDLVLAWIGTVCDVQATLTVGTARLVVTPAPREGCDALAAGRGVVLSFAQPPDPASIEVVLDETARLPEPT